MYTEAQLLQQIADARQHGSAAHPRVLQACQFLADWYVSVGRLKDAEQRWVNLTQELDQLPEAKRIDRAVAYVRRAEVLHSLGKLPDEQSALWTAIEILHQESQPPRVDLAYILNQLAEVTYELGRYETALTASQQALAWLTDVVPATHHELIRTRNNLAAAHSVRGELALAERLLRQNLTLLAQQYGEQDSALVIPLQNLAEVLRATGKQLEAEKLLSTANQLSHRRLGASHAVTLHGLMLLADVHTFRGDFSTAERLLRKVWETRRETAPHDHIALARTQHELGKLLCLRNRYRDAEPILDEALRILESLLGETHPKTSAVCVTLSHVYLGLGRFANAERAIQRAQGIQQLSLHPRASTHAETHRQHARIAGARGDVVQARQAIQAALEHLERQNDRSVDQVFAVRLTAAELALNNGQIEEAATHLEHAGDVRKSPLISLLSRIQYRRLLVQQALSQGDLEAAEVAVQRALTLLHHLPNHPPGEVADIAAVAAETALQRQDFTTCLSFCEQELAFRKTLGQTESITMSQALVRQAQASIGLQAYADAVAPLQQALTIAERSYQSPPGFVPDLVAQLARLHLLLRDFQSFRPWMQRTLSLMEASDAAPDTQPCEDWITVLREAGEAATADELTDQLVILRNRQAHVLGDLL